MLVYVDEQKEEREGKLMREITLRKAEKTDRDAVLALYRACAGLDTCCWNEEYPDAGTLEEDLARGALYVWMEDGALAGAASLLDFDDVEEAGLPFRFTQRPCVLCRLCVTPARQGGGEGRRLLSAAERKARSLGYGAVHLLCDERQESANRLYRSAGYTAVGRIALYGLSFNAYEKLLEHAGQDGRSEAIAF